MFFILLILKSMTAWHKTNHSNECSILLKDIKPTIFKILKISLLDFNLYILKTEKKHTTFYLCVLLLNLKN